MRIAVTGAGGFIGRYLVPSLARQDHNVVALGRQEAGLSHLAGVNATVIASDYSQASLVDALSGVDAIVHLAGRRTQREDPALAVSPFVEANILLTERLLRAAQDCGVRKVVMASSIAVYSKRNTLPYRESEGVRGLNPYGLSKIVGENLLSQWSDAVGGSAISLRLAASYGFGERISAVLMRFIDRAARGEPLVVDGAVNMAIDQLYVRDAVSAITQALSADVSGNFNIGAGQAFTLKDMALATSKAFGSVSKVHLNGPVLSEPPAPYMDIASAHRHLNWTPQWSLADALNDISSLWRANGSSRAEDSQ